MATAAASTSLVPVPPVFSDAERLALAGYLAGCRGLTRRPARSTCASSPAGAAPARCRCSRSAAPTSRPSPANSKPAGGPAPPSPAACPPSPVSTGTPWRRNFSTTRPPRTSAGRGWTTSRTPPPWTATRSARSWSPPGSAGRGARPDLPAGPQRPAGVRGDRRGHRAPGPGTRAPDPGHHPQGREGRHDPARPAHRPRHRPGDRRAHRGPAVPRRRRQAAGPARGRPHRPPGHPPGGYRQAGQPAHLRHAFITAALDAGVPLRDVQEAASHADPRTTMRYDRARRLPD